ncbi:hypothetical protein DH2020_044333 [Rehmannia glutinosa]|uniref:Uncharacterized protein n=1 Tax=Rehmannia glutinosa TaxID=99300 RepID=A0ABR0UIC4_REHGL
MPPPPPLTAAITLAPLLLFLLLARPTVSWRPWPNAQPNSTDFLYGGSKNGRAPRSVSSASSSPPYPPSIRSRRPYPAGGKPSSSIPIRPAQTFPERSTSASRRTTGSTPTESPSRASPSNRLLNRRSPPLRAPPDQPQERVYLLLTSDDVYVQDFCNNICGFHYFTFPSIVGYTLPYAWVGNSAKLCPGVCAYPFAVPDYIPGLKAVKSPNGDVGVDGMISVIAHEIAELSTNPLVNAWYAGQDPVFPVEIADLCEGIYGTGEVGRTPGRC